MGGLFNGLLLDLDGTLVDSERLHFQSTRQVLAGRGLELEWPDFVRYEGWDETAIWRDLGGRLGFAVDAKALAAERTDAFCDLLARHPVPLLPGAMNLAAWAGARGLPRAIASSLPRRQIDAVLAAAGLGDLLPLRLSGHDDLPDGRGKPAADIYLAAAATIGQPPGACIAIEDSGVGIQSACAAGCLVIAVGPGDGPGPYRRAASLHEVLPILEALIA